MGSYMNKLMALIKKGQYGVAFLKIIGWFSHRLDSLFFRIFCLLPIRNDLILFRSTSDFSDNARVFYDYLLKQGFNKDHKIVWILDESNPHDYVAPDNVKFVRLMSWHPVVLKDYYCAVAKCFIFTHGSGMTYSRPGQTLIHTSHSASQLKAPKPASPREAKLKRDYTLTCGPDGVAKKKIVLGMSEDRLPTLGMPRLDLLYRDNNCLPFLLENYQGERIILSMETFKQSRQIVDSTNNDDIYAINVIHSKEELISLNSFLKENDTILIVKIHPWQDLSFLDFAKLENIYFLTNQDLDNKGVQLYELVEKSSALLTDYSSVFYDFLLLDRPIGFLLKDMSMYDRGFISEDPTKDMVGEKIYTLDDLKTFILESAAGIDRYAEARKELRDRVFTYQDGDNCQRLYEWMKKKDIIS